MPEPPADFRSDRRRTPLHFDMETQDPDDVMTLAIAAAHPRVELFSVTLMPGTRDQVGLVHHVLGLLGVRVGPGAGPRVLCVGAQYPATAKPPSVSAFHNKWLGQFGPVDPTHRAEDTLDIAVAAGCTLLTGAPLKNLHGVPRFPRWVAQGGFAGDSVVPPEHRLPKFAGRETCPTFNFGGAPKVAEAMLASPHIGAKILVGKNVCHGVTWDRAFHERVKALPRVTTGMALVMRGMELYLRQHPEGKKLHDPLALAVAIDPSVCDFRNVEVYRERGEWGSRLKPESDVRVAVSVDRERFFSVLTSC